MNGGILFLDIATTTGWAEGLPGERPISGRLRLVSDGGPNYEAYDKLHDFLIDRFKLNRYRAVIFEKPMSPSHMAGRTTAATIRRLIGLCEVAEWVCRRSGYYGSSVMTADVHDVRKHLLGGRPAKGDAKREVIAALRGLGFDPADDNEADAIAGWLYAAAQVDPKAAPPTGPLFRGR